MNAEEVTKSYNVIVGAIEHGVKQGVYDLSELAQILPALGRLTKHIDELQNKS